MIARTVIIMAAPMAALALPCWRNRPCASHAFAAMLFAPGVLDWRGAPAANLNRHSGIAPSSGAFTGVPVPAGATCASAAVLEDGAA